MVAVTTDEALDAMAAEGFDCHLSFPEKDGLHLQAWRSDDPDLDTEMEVVAATRLEAFEQMAVLAKEYNRTLRRLVDGEQLNCPHCSITLVAHTYYPGEQSRLVIFHEGNAPDRPDTAAHPPVTAAGLCL